MAKTNKGSADHDRALRDHLVKLLEGKQAHADFESVIQDVPAASRGIRSAGAPHSAWELLEHMRIAQHDILEFSRNAHHQSPQWPEGYWPKSPEPPDETAWERSVADLRRDLMAMQALISDPGKDLFEPIPHGEGQTLLREAMLVADHNSHHLGQLILVRRLAGAWPPRKQK
jgi:uncharacterized damage-inducible protein DinB